MKQLISLVLLPLVALLPLTGSAQKKKAKAPAPALNPSNPVYVDKSGVLRWTRNHSEAAFFGVNYTVPFAYGYRSHKALKADLEKAIDNDVYHFARLGVDAFGEKDVGALEGSAVVADGDREDGGVAGARLE